MISVRSLAKGKERVFRYWRKEEYDAALDTINELLHEWPGNAELYTLWASLVQLQEVPKHSLSDAKKALQQAMEVDRDAPAAAIELGHFLDTVEDDPKAAAQIFAEGTTVARRLLIDGLVGQARALAQLGKRDEALQCIMEALLLTNSAASTPEKSPNGRPDFLLRDRAGHILALLQLKGPYAARIEDVLDDISPRRPA